MKISKSSTFTTHSAQTEKSCLLRTSVGKLLFYICKPVVCPWRIVLGTKLFMFSVPAKNNYYNNNFLLFCTIWTFYLECFILQCPKEVYHLNKTCLVKGTLFTSWESAYTSWQLSCLKYTIYCRFNFDLHWHYIRQTGDNIYF